MTSTYSGRIQWANEIAVPDVEVRLFRQLTDGSLGMEMTEAPGLSDADGDFTLSMRDSRLIDEELLAEYDLLSSEFEVLDPGGFDLGDELRPIIQFTLEIKGQQVLFEAPFRRIHRGYHLPYNPPVEFQPSRDGFDFPNAFKFFQSSISLPFGLAEKLIPEPYGVCGGMSAAAYDYRLACLCDPTPPDIRQYHTPPKTGTRLQRYLLRRSLDTFGSLGCNVRRVGDWTLLPDEGPCGVCYLSLQELPSVLLRLQRGQCAVLALIYERAESFAEMLQKIWLNHQVLAYGYQQLGPGQYEIAIYDPNHKNQDQVKLGIEQVQVGSDSNGPVFGLQIIEEIPNRADKAVRGIFPMTYQPC
ncbi:MAG: hypothetical protein WBG37_19460, partial [Desulfobacterales bacterium]